jgi:SAM-dependent methyltransferase
MTFPFPLFTEISPLKLALYFAIIFLVIIIVRLWKNMSHDIAKSTEGFTQDIPFVLKENGDIYDEFYVEIYDKLTDSKKRAQYDITVIRDTTKMDLEKANILDIGCGDGELVRQFSRIGASFVKGVDKSPAMVMRSQTSPPLLRNAKIVCADVTEDGTTLFERGSLTHVLCLYMTIYEFSDKMRLFRNIFYGLEPGGYFVIHLVKGCGGGGGGGETFNGLINLGKPKALQESDIIASGIHKLITDFGGGFLYERDWSDPYLLKEKFTDHQTHSVRQNELNWFYEPIDAIVEKCKKCGFRMVSSIVPEDLTVGGFLYFFQKPGLLLRK